MTDESGSSPAHPRPSTPTTDVIAVEAIRFDLSWEQPDDFDILDRLEQDRARRFHYELHRRRFVVAHACVRRVLGERLNQAPATVQITRTPLGKPILALDADPTSTGALPSLHFNLSHCDDIGWLTLASRPVGVDVERIRDLEELLPLIQSHCTASEIDSLIGLPATERASAFLQIWTRKEAVLKAWGTGIGEVELHTLGVGLDGSRVQAQGELSRAHPGRFFALSVATRRLDGEILSVAVDADRTLEVMLRDHRPAG